MASTLIQRIVAPGFDQEPLGLHAIMAVAQEVIAGRLPDEAMTSWLDAPELEDAGFVIGRIAAGDFTVSEVERLLYLGEGGIYTYGQIEFILGLVPS